MQKKPKSQAAKRLDALQDVARELITARKLDTVLSMIVEKAVDLMECDAGSLYLKQNENFLIFEISVNRSIEFTFERILIPVNSNGLATYVFRSGEALRLSDAYEIPATAQYVFDPTFDLQTGYRTRSVMVQPLTSSKGERLGVLQLINRKHRSNEKWPSRNAKAIEKMPDFSEDDEKLLASFAAIASAALENARLYKNIENVFEGFVTASIQAIESRDVGTRGHSERVAILTLELAKRVSESQEREILHINFSETQLAEIRYAALLHDFGKIAVRESVLQKEEKLSPMQKLAIRSRLQDFKSAAEIQALRQLIRQLSTEHRAPTDIELARLEKFVREAQKQFDDYWSLILELNSPNIVEKNMTPRLEKLHGLECHGTDGHAHPLLVQDETFSLSIRRGSLTPTERREIESHVTHTYYFLQRIPWTSELNQIPEIAYGHHEFLDGTGYPRGIPAEKIPMQSRMMTICDIFDALVASDRPYKPSLPFHSALDILHSMAKANKLDPRFLKVFLEARIYETPDFKRLIYPSRKTA